MKYVWAMDISLKNTGIAIFDCESRTPVTCFSIPTNNRLETKDRLKVIGNTLLDYLEKYPCKTLIMENSFTRFNKATQQLYRCHGVVNYIFADYEQYYFSPRSIKKLLVGDGKADKKEVQEVIKNKFPDILFSNDDESDALGIGCIYFELNENDNLNKESI